MQIVLNKPLTEVATLADAIQKVLNYRGGMIITVYEKEACILMNQISNGYEGQIKRGYAFKCLSNMRETNTWTEGEITNIEKRMGEIIKEGDSEFFYFATLADFCRAALENGWH